MNVAQETLGLRRQGLSPCLSLLMSAFALPIPPAGVTPHLHRPTERSPTISAVSYQQNPRAYLADQALQHARDRDIFLAPARCYGLLYIAEIRRISASQHLQVNHGGSNHGKAGFADS